MLMLAFHFIWLQLLFAFAGGLVLLHFAGKTNSAPLKVGGFVLVAGAILSTVCVLYYAAKYMGQGAFESAHPMMMQGMGMNMMGKCMGKMNKNEGGMNGAMMNDGEMKDGTASDHNAHHPGDATESTTPK